MEIERLFNTDVPFITEGDNDPYRKFLYELFNGKQLNVCPELEKYRINLFLIINGYIEKNDDYIYYQEYWRDYIDLAVSLVKKLGNIKVSKLLIDKISTGYRLKADKFLKIIEFIYLPKEINNFKDYLDTSLLIYDYYLDVKEPINKKYDIGNEELNNYFEYIAELFRHGVSFTTLRVESRMICLIFAYLHYNGINDYELIKRYLDNINYYKDKFVLNNCFPYQVDVKYFNGNFYNYEIAKLVFDNMDGLLTKDINAIR